MSHLPPETARFDPSRRAARAIKGIQALAEIDEDLCALDYANFSKSLAFASQEGFAIEVSFDGEKISRLLTLPFRTPKRCWPCSSR